MSVIRHCHAPVGVVVGTWEKMCKRAHRWMAYVGLGVRIVSLIDRHDTSPTLCMSKQTMVISNSHEVALELCM